jgi:hypothetical protein
MIHAEYCRNKVARQNMLSTLFPDGIWVHKIGGGYLTDSELNERYPISGPLTEWNHARKGKGKNPNVKNNFKDLC